jgi:membrane protein DedA with SNARE-associated domain
VITAGVFAATGEPNVFLVVVVAAVGAFAGDHVSYFVGRFVRDRWRRRRPAGGPKEALSRAAGAGNGTPGRRRALLDWAARTLDQRGGLILVVARYIPGGRTAVTLTTGAVGYPLRLFSSFDAIGAVTWGIYCTMIGYLGGKAFEDNPIAGLLVGLGVALAISILTEVVHRYRRRRPSRRTGGSADRAGRTPVAVEDAERGGGR